MNNETTSDTPETDAAKRRINGMADEWVPRYVSEQLERERDEAKFDAADESRWAMSYKTQRDELREALSACMEDSVELLSERGWWKDESRSGYAERYAQTVENIREAQALLATPQK